MQAAKAIISQMKHQPLRSVLISIFALAGAVQMPAASWYIDNSAAGGQNSGASWSNAWTSFRAINWQLIHPGDVLYISGGGVSQTYTESWAVGSGGSPANPITIAAGQDAGHNGIVIFDYNADGDTSTRTAITVNQNYVTFNGNYAGVNHIRLVNLRNINDRYGSNGVS